MTSSPERVMHEHSAEQLAIRSAPPFALDPGEFRARVAVAECVLSTAGPVMSLRIQFGAPDFDGSTRASAHLAFAPVQAPAAMTTA